MCLLLKIVVTCSKSKSHVILHKIQCVSIPKMVVWERVYVYCELYKERVNALCEQNV
jgi:hypothetical protein